MARTLFWVGPSAVMSTKTEREGAKAELVKYLAPCARKRGGESLFIEVVDGKATSTGRSDYLNVRTIGNHNGKPVMSSWLNQLICKAFGYRFNAQREAVTVTGCGYSKTHQIAEELAALLGRPIYCSGAETGWRGT